MVRLCVQIQITKAMHLDLMWGILIQYGGLRDYGMVPMMISLRSMILDIYVEMI